MFKNTLTYNESIIGSIETNKRMTIIDTAQALNINMDDYYSNSDKYDVIWDGIEVKQNARFDGKVYYAETRVWKNGELQVI